MPWSLSNTFGDEALQIPWKIPVPLEAPRVNESNSRAAWE
jgi:hypothetical protein